MLSSEARNKFEENLVKVTVKVTDLKSPRYQQIEVYIDTLVSRVHLNWHPIAWNRLLRVIRFFKYPKIIYQEQKLRIL